MELILIKWHDTCSHQIISFLGCAFSHFLYFLLPNVHFMVLLWGTFSEPQRNILVLIISGDTNPTHTYTLPSPPHLWVQKAERRVSCYDRVQLTITGSYHVEEQTQPRFLLIGTTGCLSGRTKAPFIISEIISQNIISD